MFSFLRRKQSATPDGAGTQVAALVDRIEQLERKLARLSDDLAELEDGIVRRLDKYRKRMEREDAAQPPADAPPQGTRGPPARVLSFDPLAIRRGTRTFPGGSR